MLTLKKLKSKSADGDIFAQYNLSACCLVGLAVDRNVNLAFDLCKRDASSVMVEAQKYVSTMYENGARTAAN